MKTVFVEDVSTDATMTPSSPLWCFRMTGVHHVRSDLMEPNLMVDLVKAQTQTGRRWDALAGKSA